MSDRPEPEELEQESIPEAGGHAGDPEETAERLTVPPGVEIPGYGERHIAPEEAPNAEEFAERAERLERSNAPSGDVQGLSRDPDADEE